MSQNNQGTAPVAPLLRAIGENVFNEMGLCYIAEGDKDSFNTYKTGVESVIKAFSQDPDVTGNAGEVVNKVQNHPLIKLESYTPFEPSEWHSYWREYQPKGPFQWEILPTNVQDELSNDMIGEVGSETEGVLTNGDATLGIQGLVPQLDDPTLVNLDGEKPTTTQGIVDNEFIGYRVSGGSGEYAPITEDNVFEKMDLLVKNMPYLLRRRKARNRQSIKWMVGQKTKGCIDAASRKLTDKGVDIDMEGIERYAGYEIVENPAMPENTILLASQTTDIRSCAYQMGTASTGDFANLHVEKKPGVKRGWEMLLTWAVEIKLVRPEEVAWYTPAVIP